MNPFQGFTYARGQIAVEICPSWSEGEVWVFVNDIDWILTLDSQQAFSQVLTRFDPFQTHG